MRNRFLAGTLLIGLTFMVNAGCANKGDRWSDRPDTKTPSDQQKTVTIFTSGRVEFVPGADGISRVKVSFEGKVGKASRYSIDRPYSLETDGAIVERANGTELEIIESSELQHRFPHIEPLAPGFCSLRQNPNGTYYCEKSSCTGSCKLHNIPARCSCD